MKPDEIRKLLGGFATGTLTERERELLFSAALEDQALFDALANEEALRELLADPATREELLEELQALPVVNGRAAALARASAPALLASESAWTWPWAMSSRRLALAGVFAAVVLTIGVLQYFRQKERARSVDVAMTQAPPPPEIAPQPVIERPKLEPLPAPPARSDAAPKESAPSALPQSGQVTEKRERQGGTAREEADRSALDRVAAVSVAPQAPTPEAAPPLAKDLPLSGRAKSLTEELAANKSVQSAPQPPPPAPRLAAPALSGRFAGVAAFNARVTDVNGTVVSIGAGTSAGVKAGELLEVVRENRALGVIRITEARDTFAVGIFEPARVAQANAVRAADARENAVESPRAGDLVRRPTASPAR